MILADQAQFRGLLTAARYCLTDVTCESQFVAVLLARPDFITRARQVVSPVWFSNEQARKLYGVFLEVAWTCETNGWPVKLDRATIDQCLITQGKQAGFWQDRELVSYLEGVEVIARAVNADDAKRMVDGLQSAAARTALFDRTLTTLTELIREQRACNPQLQITALLNDLHQINHGHSAKDAGMQAVGSCNLNDLGAPWEVVPTHLPTLADLIGGFQPGRFYAVSARTGVGKSTLLNSIAVNAAVEQEIPTLVLDVEMQRREVLLRAVSNLAEIDERAIVRKTYTVAEAERVEQQMARIKAAPLYHVQVGPMAFEDMLGWFSHFKRSVVDTRADGRALIILDYLRAPGGDREWQALGHQADRLKQMATSLQLPVIAGVQAGRQADAMDHADYADRSVGTIGGSDRIAHHADFACALRNLRSDEQEKVLAKFSPRPEPDHEPRNRLRFNQVLHVGKQRAGATLGGGIPLFCRFGQSRYEDVGVRRDEAGNPITVNGRMMPSEERHYIHSADFIRKTARRRSDRSNLPTQKAIQPREKAA
ncbi:MAG: DnaB-like helicase C-terminal domain-containing protein [Tepidisphaeraceae bacterium]